jgi:hypothetical protein
MSSLRLLMMRWRQLRLLLIPTWCFDKA